MKVAILAGGKGTRLGLTDRPKPMAPVAGVPLLERQIVLAAEHGLKDIVLLNGHLGHVIEDYFGDGSRFGVRIRHCQEPEPLGSAGAVRAARALLDTPFLLLYGDTLMDVDLARLARVHHEGGAIGTLFVHPNDHPFDSDLVEVGADRFVRRFLAKPHAEGALLPNLANAALYALQPEAIDFVPADRASDWGKDVFPAIVAAGERLLSYRSCEYIKDMGTPARLALGDADLASGRVARLSRRAPKPAVFLDRDGVLNIEKGGVHHPADLELEAGAGAALARINAAGVPAICVTNQPDIAKGFLSEDDLVAVMAALDMRLAEAGSYLDDFYYCPHHPEAGWPGEVPALKIACECRKPGPGMLLQAAQDHLIDLERSWLIGDRYCDIAAAHAAGARGVLVRTGHAGADAASFAHDEPDFVADTLHAAVDYVLERMT